MNAISFIVCLFSLIGAVDYILGNRFGLGKEFERGFKLLGTMALSMIGMITVSSVIADIIDPCLTFVYEKFCLDPSLVPAIIFANDMGGASLAKELSKNDNLGMFNALVVSSMMGCTISFTIPIAMQCVNKNRHRELMMGLMCGIVTIPIGCLFAGIFSGLSILELIVNLLPIAIFAVILACGLLNFPDICIKVFNSLGIFIKSIIIWGLALGIVKFLTGIEIVQGLVDFEEGALICFNAAVVMSGTFPLIAILRKVFSKFLVNLGSKIEINSASAMGFVSTLATNVTTFEIMNEMDEKGAILNAAFAVSAAFTFAGHLAFTMAFDTSYIIRVIVAKLISGASALIFASVMYRKIKRH